MVETTATIELQDAMLGCMLIGSFALSVFFAVQYKRGCGPWEPIYLCVVEVLFDIIYLIGVNEKIHPEVEVDLVGADSGHSEITIPSRTIFTLNNLLIGPIWIWTVLRAVSDGNLNLYLRHIGVTFTILMSFAVGSLGGSDRVRTIATVSKSLLATVILFFLVLLYRDTARKADTIFKKMLLRWRKCFLFLMVIMILIISVANHSYDISESSTELEKLILFTAARFWLLVCFSIFIYLFHQKLRLSAEDVGDVEMRVGNGVEQRERLLRDQMLNGLGEVRVRAERARNAWMESKMYDETLNFDDSSLVFHHVRGMVTRGQLHQGGDIAREVAALRDEMGSNNATRSTIRRRVVAVNRAVGRALSRI